MRNLQQVKTVFKKIVQWGLLFSGILFLTIILLANTTLPFWARYQLGKSKAFIPENAQTIVIMGAGGFPSEGLLMRLWYTHQLAEKFPTATVVITTPGQTFNPKSTISQMRNTLIEWGVDSSLILLENIGLNTRHQALMCYEMYRQNQFKEPVVIVTSPEHIYRSVLCFEKAGFHNVTGQSCSDVELEANLKINTRKLGGNTIIPNVGNSISIRYKFWDNLRTEVSVLREYIAIVYYSLKNWI